MNKLKCLVAFICLVMIASGKATQHDSNSFQYIGPGGMGYFWAQARDPINENILLVGADVGGIFITRDAGMSFVQYTNGMDKTKQIHDIMIKETNGHIYSFAATSEGVYRSIDYGKWFECTNGFRDSPGSSSGSFKHSMRTVAASKTEPLIIWAGVGETIRRYDAVNDPTQVYASYDLGNSWNPKLNISEAQINDIAVLNKTHVWVSSTRGLYATGTGGDDWWGVGGATLKWSNNGGYSWTNCSDVPSNYLLSGGCIAGSSTIPAACEDDHSTVNASHVHCIPPTQVSPRLPYVYSVIATNTSSLGLGDPLGFRLTITNIDLMYGDYYGLSSFSTCSFARMDTDLVAFRGGVYESLDGGLTWAWMLKNANNTPTATKCRLRCQSSMDYRFSNTQFFTVEVNPKNPRHYISANAGQDAGFWEAVGDAGSGSIGEWKIYYSEEFCTDSGNPNSVALRDCFEGQKTQANDNQLGPNLDRVLVRDWNSHKNVGSDVGKLTDRPDGIYGRPTMIGTHSRGVLAGYWDYEKERYSFKHWMNNIVSTSVEPYVWKSTGLDDTCVLGKVATLCTEGIEFPGIPPMVRDGYERTLKTRSIFVPVGDGGLFASRDEGATWQLVSDLWKTLGDRSESVAVNSKSNTVYSGNLRLERVSVHEGTQVGTEWTIIGGYDYTSAGTCDSTQYCNGITTNTKTMYTIKVIEEDEENRRLYGLPLLIAGVRGDEDGLLGYYPEFIDPEGTNGTFGGGQWVPLLGESIDRCTVISGTTDIYVIGIEVVKKEERTFAIVSADGHDDYDGVYVVPLAYNTTLKCIHLGQLPAGTCISGCPGGSGRGGKLRVASIDSVGNTIMMTVWSWYRQQLLYTTISSGVESFASLLNDTQYLDNSFVWTPSLKVTEFEVTPFYIEDIEVYPLNKSLCFLTLSLSPYRDDYIPNVLFASFNGGQSWTHLSSSNSSIWKSEIPMVDWTTLPSVDLTLTFTQDGKELFASPECQSIYHASTSIFAGGSTAVECELWAPINEKEPLGQVEDHTIYYIIAGSVVGAAGLLFGAFYKHRKRTKNRKIKGIPGGLVGGKDVNMNRIWI